MTVYHPTLKQLQYLVSLHEHGHFGRAAEACFVSQSTLSAGLRDLETLLGVVLVERTKRAVRFTPLGNAVVAKAHRILREAEELSDMVQSAGQPLSGEVRMSVIPTIAPFLLPRMLPRLRRERPALKLFLREETSAQAMESLHHGRADCVLLALPYALGDLEVMDLGEDRFSVVYPADHRLPASGVATPADIASENLLLLEDGHCLRDQALAACELESARRNTAFNGTSLHTLAQMVANGLGVTLMPQMALDAGIVRGLDVAVRPMADGTSHRRIGLVWRRTSARKETFRRLGEALRPFL